MHPVRCMPVIILIAVFIFAPLSHQREDEECGLDFTTVVVKKARGRLGNHVWLIMTMINYELRYGVKAYITEESRWILNEYFKGMYRLWCNCDTDRVLLLNFFDFAF